MATWPPLQLHPTPRSFHVNRGVNKTAAEYNIFGHVSPKQKIMLMMVLAMTCSQAELYRLMDLLYIEVFEEQPKPRTVEEARMKLLKVINNIKAYSLEELRSKLGL